MLSMESRQSRPVRSGVVALTIALVVATLVVGGTPGARAGAGQGQVFTEHIVDGAFDVPYTVFAVDLDRDGDTDLLATAESDDEVAWWENNGRQNFAKHTIDAALDGAACVYAMDMDGDLDVDVVAAGAWGDDVVWYENRGNETFRRHDIDGSFSHPHWVQAVDLDGDGDVDVAGAAYYSGEVAWWENDGGQRFAKRSLGYGDHPRWGHPIDVDGDLDLDLVIAERWGDVVVWWENDGGELFTEHLIGALDGATGVFAADVDDDGDNDVVGAGAGVSEIVWWENDGMAGFTEHLVGALTSASSVHAGDMDLDGDVDIVGGGWSLAWFENDGNEGFAQHAICDSYGETAWSVHVADVDGDLDEDIAAAAPEYDVIGWWENKDLQEIPAFFDDFTYEDLEDMEAFGWSIVNRPSGPPSGRLAGDMDETQTTLPLLEARFWDGATVVVDTEVIKILSDGDTPTPTVERGYLGTAPATHAADTEVLSIYARSNVSVQYDPWAESYVLVLKADRGDVFQMSRVETPVRFLEGTYGASVLVNDAPKIRSDTSVQAFYTINGREGEAYAECDFEYLPWNTEDWGTCQGGGDINASRLWTISWAEAGSNPTCDPAADPPGTHLIYDRIGSLADHWAQWVMQAEDREARYFVDGVQEGPVHGEPYSPENDMQIALANWIQEGSAAPNNAIYTLAVDWVLHVPNRVLAPCEMEALVAAYRAAGMGQMDYTELHVHDIRMNYREREGRYLVAAAVGIVDETRAPVEGAIVEVQWSLPDGRTQVQEGVTDAAGKALFRVNSPATGMYELCVTDAVKAGYAYDPSQDRVQCETLEAP